MTEKKYWSNEKMPADVDEPKVCEPDDYWCRKKEPAEPEVEDESKLDNPFSQPWEDSDLVLVVEDEKFHVHRLMLSLNSPVFKAMFKSEFKEATSGEITLPEKNANEVLDFVKQLYMDKREEITMESVEHLLRLAEEYQVKGILDLCASCLRMEPKTEFNAMKILLLAQQYRLTNIAKGCHNVLAKMNLERLERYLEFPLLNNENLRGILLPRMRKLEELVRELSPQVAGVVACTTWLWNETKKPMAWCPSHFSNGKPKVSLRDSLGTCPACKQVIQRLALSTTRTVQESVKGTRYFDSVTRTYLYTDGTDHFDESLANVLEELFNL